MTGLGTGLPLFVALGFLLLGPKRMHAMLGQLARVKAEFDKASRGLKSQLTAELEGRPPAVSRDDDKTASAGCPTSA
jgi:Sec-independent protein translocase protein TatA